MSSTRDVIEEYCRTLEARDWDGFAAVLAEGVRYEIPQTGEVIEGREKYVRFNREYPGEWHIWPVRLVAEGEHAALWISFEVGGERVHGIGFFTVAGGLVREISDFWPEPYEPPAGREHLVTRAAVR
jgi:hypothetical protein